MRSIIMTLPKSGTRMLTSLIDSHPELSCSFDQEDVDVGVFHFFNLKWEWLVDHNVKKVLLERDIFRGSCSEMISGHNQRATGEYNLAPNSVQILMDRRMLQTELMRAHADLVLDYDDITDGGTEIVEWRCSPLCQLLGVTNETMVSSMRKLPTVLPKNLEELRVRTFC